MPYQKSLLMMNHLVIVKSDKSTYNMSHLIFEEVSFDNLKHKEKYLISYNVNSYNIGIFTMYNTRHVVHNSHSTTPIATFKYARFNIIQIDNMYTEVIRHFSKHFTRSISYYKLNNKKHLIQEAMEQRALNIILRNLIGDNMFKY
jgi:hypothetical protein